MRRTNPSRGRRAFSPSQVAEIRQMYARGMAQTEIARAFQVNSQTIGRLLRGDTYIGVTAEGSQAPVADQYRVQTIPTTLEEQQAMAERIMARARAGGGIDIPPPKATSAPEVDNGPLTEAEALAYKTFGFVPGRPNYQPNEADSDNQLGSGADPA